MGMDDKLEEIIDSYSLNINRKKRARGAVILETEQGLFMAKMYRFGEHKAVYEETIKTQLAGCDGILTDNAIKNKNGNYLTRDGSGDNWIIRRWYEGEEFDIKDINQIGKAAKNLGKLHNGLAQCELEEISEKHRFDNNIDNVMHRHNRELKHIYNYIKAKKQKNDMEIYLIKSFQQFFDQGMEAEEYLKKSNFDMLRKKSADTGAIIHGSYNYHNIFFCGKNIMTTNFEKAEPGIQVTDLYDFIRKVMEKNGWRFDMGVKVFESYRSVRTVEKDERQTLYALLCYPEKYWKIMNFYYNSRKSWVSEKNLEKLRKICDQEEERQRFLTDIKRLLF